MTITAIAPAIQASTPITTDKNHTAQSVVLNFDNYGSYWGTSTIQETEQSLTESRSTGASIQEWQVTDRQGRPMRVVRIADPDFLDTISVFSA